MPTIKYMSNETAQNSTERRVVPAEYYEIFGYKMLGLTYKQIAEKTGYSYDRIRHLFATGGALHELWRGWVKDKKSQLVEDAVDIMYAHLPEIIKARVVHAKKDDPGAVFSSKMIMEHTLGDPRRQVREQQQPATLAEWIKQETLKEKQEHADQQAATAGEHGTGAARAVAGDLPVGQAAGGDTERQPEPPHGGA